MKSRIFISWSGELSNKLANEIRQWLPNVIQFAEPYFTPEDIEKGTSWSKSIGEELERSIVGLICLTKDNIDNPWILFEAGALSKNLNKANVCVILFDLKPTDVTGPLASFQATSFNKKDFKILLETINNAGGKSKLENTILNNVFEVWYPKLEKKIQHIIDSHPSQSVKKSRSTEGMLEEILGLVRLNIWSNKDRKNFPEIEKLLELIQKIQYDLTYLNLKSKQEKKELSMSNLMYKNELDRPVKKLCYQFGRLDLYERFMSGDLILTVHNLY